MNYLTQEEAIRIASRVIKDYEETTRPKFIKKIESDPMYALTWADAMFEASAQYAAWSEVLSMLNSNKATVERVAEYLQERIIWSSTPSSTSRCSNLAELCRQDAMRTVYLKLTKQGF